MTEDRGFLRALFLDHLFSKFLSLALALVTVYLIDLKLSGEVDWVDPSRRLPVLVPGETWDGEPGTPRIVLRPDPGVLVMNCEPKALKVRLQGPANRKDDFDRDPVVYVDVKSEWTSDKWEVATRNITESDFELYGKGIKITLPETIRIDVDLEKSKSVDVTLRSPPPSKLPAGYRFDRATTILEPAQIEVRGPRSVLQAITETNPLELELRDRSSYEHGERYVAGIPKSAKWLRLDAGTRIRALVSLSLEQLQELDLGEFDVYWAVRNENLVRLQASTLELENISVTAAQKARVVIEGRPADIARWSSPDKLAELRRQVYLLADPNSEITEHLQSVIDATIFVRVLGLPADLRVSVIEPDRLPVKIKRTD